ncbi:MAG: glycoside hydrolase family 3 N-terminal domain-containing protein [Pseudomonadota bacterium]
MTGAIGACVLAVCASIHDPAHLEDRLAQTTAVTARPVAVSCPSAGVNVPPVPDLTLRQTIGQLLVVGFSGTNPDEPWPALVAEQLRTGEIGGVLFLGKNVSSAKRTRDLIERFRSEAADYPPLLMIDQEGGRVQRLGPRVGVARIPSARSMAQIGSVQNAEAAYGRAAAVLRDWGLNTNLGPVADVRVNRLNPVIARLGRSYSSDPGIVARYSAAFVRGHRKEGLLTAIKHFPGHGSSRSDSHRGLTDISATWQKAAELAPFKALVAGNCADIVMSGHLVLKSYSDDTKSPGPATFSRKLITGELRERLNFSGVVITDDLDMGAIRRYYTLENSVVGAVRAGHDILLHSNIITADRKLPARIAESLLAEAYKDQEFEQMLRNAFERVWVLKARLTVPRSSEITQ